VGAENLDKKDINMLIDLLTNLHKNSSLGVFCALQETNIFHTTNFVMEIL
jgi:hypothetical protein